MAVYYNRGIIAKGAKTHHFKDKGISIRVSHKTYPDEYKKYIDLGVVFTKDKLLSVIRTSCYGNTFCVDVYKTDPYGFHNRRCLTTECKSLQECKDIIYAWFYKPTYPNY